MARMTAIYKQKNCLQAQPGSNAAAEESILHFYEYGLYHFSATVMPGEAFIDASTQSRRAIARTPDWHSGKLHPRSLNFWSKRAKSMPFARTPEVEEAAVGCCY